jgi:TetR/AcrR family transcriptional repressor of mexJK operon
MHFLNGRVRKKGRNDATKPATARRGRPIDPAKDRAILSAARRLLFAAGPDAVTMDAVARAAAVSKATLYSRHRSRLSLLAVIAADEAAALQRALAAPPATRIALARDLEDFVAALGELLSSRRHQRLMVAMGALGVARRDLATIYRNGPQRTHDRLAEYLHAAAERKLLACADADAAAELLLGMAMGLDLVRTMYRVPRRHAVKRAWAREVVRAFLRAYAAGGARAA